LDETLPSVGSIIVAHIVVTAREMRRERGVRTCNLKFAEVSER
jgi:hypothetical protein